MIWKSVALLLIIPAIGTAQESTPSKPTSTPAKTTCELGDKDYVVFEALLADIGTPEDPEEEWRGKQFLILDMTADISKTDATKGMWGFRSKSTQSPQPDTVADFTSKKGDRCSVHAGFGNQKAYSIIEAAETESYFDRKKGNRDGWKVFYERHPNAAGYWQFSRPAYNASADEALVYVSHSCGWLCGTGHLYLLAKENDQWKVKNRVMLWIS